MGQSGTIPITTVGGNGAAVGDEDSDPMFGLLTEITLDYNAAAPAGTVVTFTYELNGVTRTILAITGNTDVIVSPTHDIQDEANADTGFVAPFWLEGDRVNIAVTVSNALAPAVTVQLKTM